MEKMNWLKLHDHNPEYQLWADKIKAKEMAANLFGEEHVIPLYGVWDSFDDIDFDSLPDHFILKTNNDSGSLMGCESKSTFDFDAARAFYADKMTKNRFYKRFREWGYKDMEPKILAEKYIDCLREYGYMEYMFFCFNGRVEFINVYSGKSNRDH